MVEIITYETLYDLLRKEKVSGELQALDKGFLEKMLNYLKEKQKLLESHEKKASFTIDIKKAQKELENIRRMFRELYERREHKLLTLAAFDSRSKSQDTRNMLEEEKRMFTEIVSALDFYRSGIVESILSLNQPSLEQAPKSIKTESLPPQGANKLIRFTNPVPKFVDSNLNVYGPYEQEDVANVPKKIADILIKNQRAEEIKNEIRQEAQ